MRSALRGRWPLLRPLAASVLLALVACTGSGGSPRSHSSRRATIPRTETENEATVAAPGAQTGKCGVERWDVKVGNDLGPTPVGRTVIPASIAELTALRAPSNPTTRVAPVETNEYQLTVTLVEYKVEADSDVHLVLSDAGHTMIAEIPSPSCVGPSSPFGPAIAASRAAFDARYPEATSLTPVGKQVTVIGVGFFDRLHGQAGVAPNGIELHPVLSISFG